jgi:hemerythrin-like domain-containing protein
MYELLDELKLMGVETSWSEEIDAKMHVLAGLVKTHLKQEEQVVFPMVEKLIPESTLMDLTDDYLDRCKIYLELAMDDTTLEVSRSDVITFFY